ncbi:EAL domain-containing protein (putative c-di-GMP-specific phosphodiesterase class I) [Paraburkholderia sp. GAS348]
MRQPSRVAERRVRTYRHPFAYMIPPTIPSLIARAADHPFLGEHLVMGTGVHSEVALAQCDGFELASAYEPIFDISVHALAQSLSSGAEGVDRFGDELGFQAVTRRLDGEPFDVFDPFDRIADDQELVALDRMSRALHAINFFGAQRHGLLFLRVHERLLKSVKYDHGRHFSSVLLSFGLNPSRVVIELPAAAVAHKTFLGYLTKSYQRYGFKVAGNLSNAGQILSVSETARLDFIKMDAAIALRDAMVKPLVGYASRLRIPLIFNRVVDEPQFLALQQYDVRFVQGPLFTAHYHDRAA